MRRAMELTKACDGGAEETASLLAHDEVRGTRRAEPPLRRPGASARREGSGTGAASDSPAAAPKSAEGRAWQADAAPAEKTGVCRICHEEELLRDGDSAALLAPCACAGSMRYAHRECVQRWIDEKRDGTCEVCGAKFEGPFTVPWRRDEPVRVAVPPASAAAGASAPGIGRDDAHVGELGVSGGWSWWRVAMLSLIGLLIVRNMLVSSFLDGGAAHGQAAADTAAAAAAAQPPPATGGVDGVPAETESPMLLVAVFLLRVMGFVLPLYLLARAWSIMRARQREDNQEDALVVTDFAWLTRAPDAQQPHEHRDRVPPLSMHEFAV